MANLDCRHTRRMHAASSLAGMTGSSFLSLRTHWKRSRLTSNWSQPVTLPAVGLPKRGSPSPSPGSMWGPSGCQRVSSLSTLQHTEHGISAPAAPCEPQCFSPAVLTRESLFTSMLMQ